MAKGVRVMAQVEAKNLKELRSLKIEMEMGSDQGGYS